MAARNLLLCLLGVLAGCGVPDYTAVRDWARTASIAADHPAPMRRDAAPPQSRTGIGAGQAMARPVATTAAGIHAMQSALATYLAALATLASDGVLTYRDDPFADLAPRAAAVHAGGGAAVGSLGGFLRDASRANMRAPEMRDAIASVDPAVQALVSGLAATLAEACGTSPGAGHAAVGGRGPAATAAPDEPSGCADAWACHAEILADIAETHAFLKANAARLTQQETQRRIRAAEDRLRRTMLRLVTYRDETTGAARSTTCPRPDNRPQAP